MKLSYTLNRDELAKAVAEYLENHATHHPEGAGWQPEHVRFGGKDDELVAVAIADVEPG